MDWHISRALQMSCLEEHQLENLHQVEKARGYCVPNWNVQSMFKLPALKEVYFVPDDPSTLARYTKQIEDLLRTKNLLTHEGKGFIGPVNLEATHSFDWGIVRNKSKLIFDYAGRGSGKSLREKTGYADGEAA